MEMWTAYVKQFSLAFCTYNFTLELENDKNAANKAKWINVNRQYNLYIFFLPTVSNPISVYKLIKHFCSFCVDVITGIYS